MKLRVANDQSNNQISEGSPLPLWFKYLFLQSLIDADGER